MAYAPFLKALADELANDPLGRGYASMTDAQAAADLNEKRYTRANDTDNARITDRTLVALFGLDRAHQILTSFQNIAASDAKAAWILEMLKDRASGGVSMALSDAAAFVDQMVTAGVLTQAEGDTLKGLGTVQYSRAEELGYINGVTEAWVRTVRGG